MDDGEFVFADGSVGLYDGGELVSLVDAGGNQQSLSSSIVDQFASIFNYGARAFIDSEFTDTPRAQAPSSPNAPGTTSANAGANWRAYLPVLLMAAGAALVARALLR